jgi:small multidrug resistance pump
MNMMQYNSWYCLIAAILFGVLGTISLKLSHGLQKLKPSILLAIFYSISFVALTLSLQGIDISIVYAVWSGVGTLLVAIIGVILFKESISFKKVFSLLLIILGVLGIHLANVLH